jgi:hypothetical protein
MKKATEQMNKLKVYLDKHPRNKLELTYRLGYRSTTTIDKWIERKNIPRIALQNVMEVIERKT